nr:serine/threonine-protein kinase [Ktedonosporobacter rubrisoli]
MNTPGRIWCTRCESLLVGAKVGSSSITSYLRQGSTSMVYLAEQSTAGERSSVVIKILRSIGSQATAENFHQEAALLSSLRHPNILPIYDYGVIGARLCQADPYWPYIVLPYAAQGSLEDIFVRERISYWEPGRVVSVIEAVAEALDYAHARGVLHRDVKPANILLLDTQVMLADFGVASLIDAEMTHLDALWVGSPAYMAPEVWQYRPGRYSDQYALAVTCYRLLTGCYPWQPASGVQNWSYLHNYVEPYTLDVYRPDLSGALDLVLQRALAKDPHERYPTLRAFASDLGKAAREATALYADVRIESEQPYALPAKPVALVAEPEEIVARPAPVTPAPAGIWPSTPVEPLLSQAHVSRNSAFQQATVLSKGEVFWGDSVHGWFDRAFNSSWIVKACVLNLLICCLMAAFVGWPLGGLALAGSFLLRLCPSLLTGMFVGYLFQRLDLHSYWQGLFWGLLFGLLNGAFSSLACYGWSALLRTLPHWGYDWLGPGDGPRIFLEQAVALAPVALVVMVPCLVLSLAGGAFIGILTAQSQQRQATALL